MDIGDIIKQKINEVAGISFIVRDWSDVLSEEVNKHVEGPDMSENLVVYGDDYPDLYEKFSVDFWVITNSNVVEYDHYKSGFNDNGSYIVYLNLPLSRLNMDMLIHESKHAYDDWNRLRNGGKPIKDTWEV